MADGKWQMAKCAPVSEDVIEGKAPEKTGALQKLHQFGCCIGRSAIFVCKESRGGLEEGPHPGPMASQARHKSGAPSGETGSRNVVPSDGRGRVIAGRGVPRAALVPRWPWAIV